MISSISNLMNFDHLSLLNDESNLKKVKSIKKILNEYKEES